MRAAITAISLAALGGCLNWQGTYDHAARAECHKLIDATERQACLNSVDDNSRKQRTARPAT
ncbi:MAG: hypothetical protein SGJ21_00955 [Alphaproteobacteria bacterium]|nr:hypothetical protein [Alphaproteobacteria bacterium]